MEEEEELRDRKVERRRVLVVEMSMVEEVGWMGRERGVAFWRFSGGGLLVGRFLVGSDLVKSQVDFQCLMDSEQMGIGLTRES